MEIAFAVVRDWATDQIERLRNQNDNPKLTEPQTAAIRGRIAAMKDLLALPDTLKARAQQADPD